MSQNKKKSEYEDSTESCLRFGFPSRSNVETQFHKSTSLRTDQKTEPEQESITHEVCHDYSDSSHLEPMIESKHRHLYSRRTSSLEKYQTLKSKNTTPNQSPYVTTE